MIESNRFIELHSYFWFFSFYFEIPWGLDEGMRRHGFRGDADAFKKKRNFLMSGVDLHLITIMTASTLCVCVCSSGGAGGSRPIHAAECQSNGRPRSICPRGNKRPFFLCVCVCVCECVSLSLTHTDIKGVREKQNRQTKKLRWIGVGEPTYS